MTEHTIGIYFNYDNFDKIDYFNPAPQSWCIYSNLDTNLTFKQNFSKSLRRLTPQLSGFQYMFIFNSFVECEQDILSQFLNRYEQESVDTIISLKEYDVFDCCLIPHHIFVNDILDKIVNSKRFGVSKYKIIEI